MSELEEILLFQIRALGLPEPKREYMFHKTRQWRWDFAWPEHKIAVEVQGGTWSGGAHARGQGLERDYRKINAGMLSGWRVFQSSSGMVKSGELVEMIGKCFETGDENA